MSKTVLKKLFIRKFRALRDVPIEFGTHVTVISGKNGTSKSSILGIAAQIFSFEKDYLKNEALSYQTITGSVFKSLPGEHFRFSDKYDTAGSLEVDVELTDGYTNSEATAELELTKRKAGARPVVRKNSTAVGGNQSRNFTHPVIFLSLKRLQPIASRDYKVESFAYLDQNVERFIAMNNELLNKTSSAATATAGSIESAVAHGTDYDQDSVSAGEDNSGQIILALMSFRKLKEEYPDYKGGLLLIDEADAGLFPAAQTKLLEILERECNELNLQVVMTSHSPTLIERTYELSKKYQRRFKTIYLSDTFGPVQAMPDFSWADIYSDLHTATVAANEEVSLPQLNVYFEDREGSDFFNTLMLRQPIKKFLNPLTDVSLGCSNYIQLVSRGVPEFSKKSLIILDADAEEGKKFETIALLPGHLPPDQLIFEFLYNLDKADPIWQNSIKFNRPLLTRCASGIIGALGIGGDNIDLSEYVKRYRSKSPENKRKLREVFKEFYKKAEFQQFLKLKGDFNPWRRWIKDNPAAVSQFRNSLEEKSVKIMQQGYGIDVSKLRALGLK